MTENETKRLQAIATLAADRLAVHAAAGGLLDDPNNDVYLEIKYADWKWLADNARDPDPGNPNRGEDVARLAAIRKGVAGAVGHRSVVVRAADVAWACAQFNDTAPAVKPAAAQRAHAAPEAKPAV